MPPAGQDQGQGSNDADEMAVDDAPAPTLLLTVAEKLFHLFAIVWGSLPDAADRRSLRLVCKPVQELIDGAWVWGHRGGCRQPRNVVYVAGVPAPCMLFPGRHGLLWNLSLIHI